MVFLRLWEADAGDYTDALQDGIKNSNVSQGLGIWQASQDNLRTGKGQNA